MRSITTQPRHDGSPHFFAKRDGLEHFEPFNINAPSRNNFGLGIWVPSAWGQITAGIPNPFWITHFAIQGIVSPQVPGPVGGALQIEFGEGPAGLETVIGRTGMSLMSSIGVPTGVDLIATGYMLPGGPHLLPPGTRLAARLATSVPGAVTVVHIRYYAVGYIDEVPVGYPVYSYGRRQRGHYPSDAQLVTPTFGTLAVTGGAGVWAWGAWVQFIAAAPNDLLIWGATDYRAIGFPLAASHVFEVATGPPLGEIARANIIVPVHLGLGGSAGWLWRPLFIKRGERVALRMKTAGGPVVMDTMLHYEEV